MGLSKLSYIEFFTMGLTCGFWLLPAANISPMGEAGFHSHMMRYDRQYVASNIDEIGGLWECYLFLIPPVGDVWFP